MRNGNPARFFRIVDEIPLHEEGCFIPDNFNGVFIRTNRSVGAEPVKFASNAIFLWNVERLFDIQRGEGNVVRDTDGKFIALENIQDPANLGAVCRTAEALGIKGAILYSCCDRYSPKSQRAAMGSLLRLPIFESSDLCADIEYLRSKGMKVYATSPDSSSAKITEISMDGGVVCVIGNEGNGVSEEVFSLCEKVTIPMKGNAESLNASMAAAITMWEMMR